MKRELLGGGGGDGVSQEDIDDAVDNHAAAGNPHPGYLTPAEGDAAYWPLSTDLATQIELDAEAALARNGDNITGGTVADARIASTIARDSEVVLQTLIDAAGDLIVGTAADTAGRLAKGSALDVLRVNAGATALEWAAPEGGGGSGADPIRLPIGGGVAPDGTGTGNNPATPEKIVSSAGQTANTPKVTYTQLLFDQSTDESWMWHFQVPSSYASGGTVRLLWGAKVTTGDVVWKAGIASTTPSSTDLDAAVFAAADLAEDPITVPGTVGHYKETTIALTMTGVAANEWVALFVGRDADNGDDSAAGDAVLVAATFEYTA